MQIPRKRQGLEQKKRPGKSHKTHPNTDGAKQHHLGDLNGRQTPGRIDPVAHRRPSQHSEADVVAERVSQEGGQNGFRRFKGVADVAQGQHIVSCHHHIADYGEEQGPAYLAGGDLAHGVDHVMPMMTMQLAKNTVKGQKKKAEHGKGQQTFRFFDHGQMIGICFFM